jgi:hypothetical protein
VVGGVGVRGCEIVGAGDGEHLDDRPPGALADRLDALGRLAPVKLDQVGPERDDGVERRVVWIHQERHAGRPPPRPVDERRGALGRQHPGAAGKKLKPR